MPELDGGPFRGSFTVVLHSSNCSSARASCCSSQGAVVAQANGGYYRNRIREYVMCSRQHLAVSTTLASTTVTVTPPTPVGLTAQCPTGQLPIAGDLASQ